MRNGSYGSGPCGITDSSLPAEVIETILNAGALSTRKLYAMKRCLFESWCAQHQADPVHCSVGSVLEFLLEHSTVPDGYGLFAGHEFLPGFFYSNGRVTGTGKS